MSELLEQMKLLNEDHKPDGWPAVRMSEINELIEIIEKKSEQLAKASERVRELERKEGLFDQYALESEVMRKALLNKDRNADDVSPSDLKQALNKFAIEQQIKALAHVLRSYKTKKFYPTNYAIQAFNDGVAHLWAHIESCELQLRKEQE